MKKAILTFFIFPLFIHAATLSLPDLIPSLVKIDGEWKQKYKGQTLTLFIDDDGTLYVKKEGKKEEAHPTVIKTLRKNYLRSHPNEDVKKFLKRYDNKLNTWVDNQTWIKNTDNKKWLDFAHGMAEHSDVSALLSSASAIENAGRVIYEGLSPGLKFVEEKEEVKIPLTGDMKDQIIAKIRKYNQYTYAQQSPEGLMVGNPPEDIHELSHGLSGAIVNFHASSSPKEGFWFPGDKVVVMEQPSVPKSLVAHSVPHIFKNTKDEMYVSGATQYESRPLYIMNEFHAYTTQAEYTIRLLEEGKPANVYSGLTGAEMAPHAVTLAKAVRDRDPQYFKKNENFKWLIATDLERMSAALKKAKKYPGTFSPGGPATWNQLATDNSVEVRELRTFLEETYGKEWTKKVLNLE